ncbi:hypothetical protein K1719_024608 [Acacia pycnantha]|nr:hypothetical protein K1719_024608 [Acacia pycnantha]
MSTPWSVFQDVAERELTVDAGAQAGARHAVISAPPAHDRGDDVSAGISMPRLGPWGTASGPRLKPTADRLSPFHIRPGAPPPPSASLPTISSTLDSLFKVLFIFPRGTCSPSAFAAFSPRRNLPPDRGCIPKQPDSRRLGPWCDRVRHDGGLTFPAPLSWGLGSWSAAEDASPYYTLDAGATEPWRAVLLVTSIGESSPRRWDDARTPRLAASSKPPRIVAVATLGPLAEKERGSWEAIIRHARRIGALATLRDAWAGGPRPDGRAQLAFKDFDGSRDLQFTPSIAFRYVLHRCEREISVAESRFGCTFLNGKRRDSWRSARSRAAAARLALCSLAPGRRGK